MRWGRRSLSLRAGTLLVLLVALVARLIYWRLAVPDYTPLSDDAQYLEIATNVANGDGFSQVFPQLELHPTAFRPPLYPYLLGGLFAIVGGPSIAWGQTLNVLIGLGVVLLVIRIGIRVGGASVGLLAGLLVAVYPPVVANDLVLLTEPLSLLLLLAAMLALLNDRWLLAGVLAGGLVLARPSAQFLIVALVIWIWASHRWRGAALGPIALVILGTAIIVAPWLVRNHVVLGDATLVTSNGFNAAALYSPQAIETGGFVDPVRDDRFDRFRLAQFDEIIWQRDLQDLAWQNVRADPLIVPPVIGRNLLAYLELRPDFNEDAERLDGRNPVVRTWTIPLFYGNLVLGTIGLVLGHRTKVGQLLLVVAAYFLASSLVFVAWPRVRVPFDVMLCLGTASCVVTAIGSRRRTASTDPIGSGPVEPTVMT